MKSLWNSHLLFLLGYSLQLAYSFVYTNHLRDEFNRSFHERCSKYPFVQKHISLLERPTNRYLIFVFQEPGLRNGGLGDRWAGLLSAVSMALRFNRTLLLQSSTGIGSLFRPYHPIDSHIDSPRYNYEDWSSWTSYSELMAAYRVRDCINNPGKRNSICSMDSGDVKEDVIILYSNRAYLCRDLFHSELRSHEELLRLLGRQPSPRSLRYSSNSSIYADIDLFEAAGCMLRLALWPTELLWREADAGYDRLTSSLSPALQTLLLASAPAVSAAITSPLRPLVQVGVHFRCGDHSYTSNSEGISSSDKYCLHDPQHAALSKQKLQELGVYNVYKAGGDPSSSGLCAASLALRFSNNSDNRKPLLLLYVASDHDGAAKQLASLAMQHASDNSIQGAWLSPAGCHVELQPTVACTRTTVLYWFLLSLSHSLVAQTEKGGVASAFSRFALLYGLRREAFYGANDCAGTSMAELSQRQQGNWFCFLHDRPKTSKGKANSKAKSKSSFWF